MGLIFGRAYVLLFIIIIFFFRGGGGLIIGILRYMQLDELKAPKPALAAAVRI